MSSLVTADEQYRTAAITADTCVEFLEDFQRDRKRWRDLYSGTRRRRTVSDALTSLDATEWTLVRWPVSGRR